MSYPCTSRILAFVLAASLLAACSSPGRNAENQAQSGFSLDAGPARVLMQEGRTSDAIALLETLAADYPDLAAPCINLSIAYRSEGKPGPARRSIDEALQREPVNAAALQQSAILYRESGEFDKSERHYLQAIEYEDAYALAHRNLGILYDIYMQRPDKALPHYRRVLELQPENSDEVSLWVADIENRQGAAQARAQ